MKNLVLMAYAQMPTLNAHADVSSWARGVHFGQSLPLHPKMFCMQASAQYSHSL